MTTEELHDLTAAYALDALDADERAAYESHLRECDDCRAELASFEDTVAVLATAHEGSRPPAGLRDRIVTAARAEPPKVVALRSRRTRYYAAVAAARRRGRARDRPLGRALGRIGRARRLALTVQPGGIAQLTASHFGAAPAGKIYEIWVIEAGGKPQPAGLFRDDARVALTRHRAEGRDRRGHARGHADGDDADAADPGGDDGLAARAVRERVHDLDEVGLRDPVRELDPVACGRGRRRGGQDLDDRDSRLRELRRLRPADQSAAEDDCDVCVDRPPVERPGAQLDLEAGLLQEAAELGLACRDDQGARHGGVKRTYPGTTPMSHPNRGG